MAKKKPSKPSPHTGKKAARAADTSVVIYLPQNLYDTYQGLNPKERHKLWHDIYNLQDSETTVWGMDHISVQLKPPPSHDQDADDSDEPYKLCDGP